MSQSSWSLWHTSKKKLVVKRKTFAGRLQKPKGTTTKISD